MFRAILLSLLMWSLSTAQAATLPEMCVESAEKPCPAPAPAPAPASDWQGELEKAQNAWKVCEADLDRFCEGVQVGEGRLERCLESHRKQLTPECRASLKARRLPPSKKNS